MMGRKRAAKGPDLSHIIEPLRQHAVPLASLVADPANARKHPERNLEGIKGSLAVYGQRKPVVVNRKTGAVEAGNGTLAAARELGWTHLAAVYVEDDAATAVGFSIADNRTAELAEWDSKVLGELLGGLGEFSDGRVETMFSDLLSEAEIARREPTAPANDPAAEWQGIPEFEHEDQTSAFRAIVHFATEDDLHKFEELVGQKIPTNTNAIWYPKTERDVVTGSGYVSDEP